MVDTLGGTGGSSKQVAFLSRHDWPWLRQTEDGSGHHRGLTLNLVARDDDDWIVVFDDVAHSIATRVPLSRRILFVTEPPGQKSYSTYAVNQFGTVVSPYRVDGFRGRWLASHPAINWFYGVAVGQDGTITSRLGLTDLRNMPVPADKAARISVVSSTKNKLPGQRARLRLLDRLRRAFPDDIDVFGRGFQQISDKADVIAPYRYHLVLENSDCPHFWTEKLADAYLGYSLPIFSGCRNVTNYFSERSMVQLPNVDDHEGAAAIIGDLLKSDPWSDRLGDIRAARVELVERQNIFSVIARLTEAIEHVHHHSTEEQFIRPGRECGPLRHFIRSGPAYRRLGMGKT
jgi:hypothetical protein